MPHLGAQVQDWERAPIVWVASAIAKVFNRCIIKFKFVSEADSVLLLHASLSTTFANASDYAYLRGHEFLSSIAGNN